MELKIPASTATSSLLLALCMISTLESRLAPGNASGEDRSGRPSAAHHAAWIGQGAAARDVCAVSWPGESAYATGPDGVFGTADDRRIPPFGVTFEGDAVPCRPANPHAACERSACALALMRAPIAFRGSAAPGHFWSGAAISR